MPRRRAEPAEPVKAWAVFPKLHNGHIYRDKAIPEVKLFAKEGEARLWLSGSATEDWDEQIDEALLRKRNSAWRGPVPVRRYVNYIEGAFTGKWLREVYADIDGLPERSPTDFLRLVIEDDLQERVSPVDCYLADDWGFADISREANRKLGHTVDDIRVADYLGQLVAATHDLEDSLRARFPTIGGKALRDFWRSWQVHRHFAEFCGNRLSRNGEPYEIDQARLRLDRLLSGFAGSLHSTSGPREAPGEVIARILTKHGITERDLVGRVEGSFSRNTLLKIKRGQRVKPSCITKLATALAGLEPGFNYTQLLP